MTDNLKNFIDGETITAKDTNDNNEYLLAQINDRAMTLNTRISSVSSNVSSQIEDFKDSFKNKGDENTPIYFNDEGKATTITKLNSNLVPALPVNYNAGVAISSGYTCPSDGVICPRVHAWIGTTCWLKINNIEVCSWSGNSDTSDTRGITGTYLVTKGDIVKFAGSNGGGVSDKPRVIFYPYK